MRPLTQIEILEVQKEIVKDGIPVRFMFDGESRNVLNGIGSGKNINVIYQRVYWNFTRDTSLKIARWTGTKAVFDVEEK